jgi:hypothetical protein
MARGTRSTACSAAVESGCMGYTILTPNAMEFLNNLASQYRHNIGSFLTPVTMLAYPVFDSFEDDRQLAGVLARISTGSCSCEYPSSFRGNYLYSGELV